MTKSKVELVVSKSDPHAIGGNLISGDVKLQVREEQLELVALEIVIECYMSTANHVEASGLDRCSSTKDAAAAKISSPFETKSSFIVSSPMSLNEGIHTLPFAVPLPLEWPPSFKIYENRVNDSVTCVATIAHSGKNSVEKLTDKHEFVYYPVSYIPDLEGETLTETRVMQSKFNKKSLKVSKILPWSRKSNDDFQSRLEISLTYPQRGFRQDKPNQFEIIIKPSDPNSPEIKVQKLSLCLVFSVISKMKILRYEDKLDYKILLSKNMVPPSKVVKLTESITYDKADELLIPSFITKMMSGKNELKINCTVTREVNGNTQIAELNESFLFTVLSPHVVQDPQATTKRDVKYEVNTSTQPSVSNGQSNHPTYAEGELPRYSNSSGNTHSIPEKQ